MKRDRIEFAIGFTVGIASGAGIVSLAAALGYLPA